jgi:hypothetical protein
MLRADNLTTVMFRLSSNVGASASWNPQGLSRLVMGLLYFYPSMEIKYNFLDTAFHGQLKIRLNSAVSSAVRPLRLLSNNKSVAFNPTLTCCCVTAVGVFFFNLNKKTFNVKGLHTIEIL